MQYSVLERVDRRRRRRRRRRGPLLLLVVAAALAAGSLVLADRWPRGHSVRAQPAPKVAAPATRRHVVVRRAVPHPRPLIGWRLPRRMHVFAPPLRAPEAILVNAATGAVLYAKRPHERRAIASTTKIMTAVLALDHLALGRRLKINPMVTRVPLLREGLRARERVPAWKLMYGLLLFSGNDDALELALATSGSRGRFVALMNEKARELGLRDSHFTTPSGVVDRGNYSSAWDLAALARYAMRDARFRRIVRTRIVHLRWSAPTYEKVYVNKNPLLGRYRGADGIKTGWTTIAGHCLVASAHRHGVRLIAVVLHSADAYNDARRLLNFGFELVRS
jgi:D-alanyl-D-alanine carboxypeptidase